MNVEVTCDEKVVRQGCNGGEKGIELCKEITKGAGVIGGGWWAVDVEDGEF